MESREHLEHILGPEQKDRVLHFWDELDEHERTVLSEQITSLDVPRALAAFTASAQQLELVPSTIEAIDSEHFFVAAAQSPDDLKRYWETGEGKGGGKYEGVYLLGLKAIAAGEVGVIVLAGGQASRLGASLPKGTLCLELESVKSLLDLQAARIARLETLAHRLTGRRGTIQW
jgi:UDP-N-acetylglucosamine/UDP-N-acetylgalactosamine diphosphorylase